MGTRSFMRAVISLLRRVMLSRLSNLSTHLIVQPLALLLLPALCRSIFLVTSNSRQLTNSIPAVSSGGIINEYEFRSWHSASHSSNPNSVPLNKVRMTRSHCSPAAGP